MRLFLRLNSGSCLAVMYGLENFEYYTLGRHILVETDHSPLEQIFKKKHCWSTSKIAESTAAVPQVRHRSKVQTRRFNTCCCRYLPCLPHQTQQGQGRIWSCALPDRENMPNWDSMYKGSNTGRPNHEPLEEHHILWLANLQTTVPTTTMGLLELQVRPSSWRRRYIERWPSNRASNRARMPSRESATNQPLLFKISSSSTSKRHDGDNNIQPLRQHLRRIRSTNYITRRLWQPVHQWARQTEM